MGKLFHIHQEVTLKTERLRIILYKAISMADSGGEGGIRTPGRFNPSTVFKTAAFDRSATSPLDLDKYSIENHKVLKQ